MTNHDFSENSNISGVISSLEARCLDLQNKSIRDTLILIADYMKYVDSSTEVKPIIQEIYKNKASRELEVRKIATKVVAEKSEVLTKVFDLIRKHGISSPKLVKVLNEVDLKSPDISDLEDVIEIICDRGHGDLVSQFVTLGSDDKTITDYRICDSSDEYLKAYSQLVRDQGTSIWGTLDDLYSVKYIVSSKDNPEQYLVKDRFLTKEDYINKLTRVHRFIIETLQKQLNILTSPEEPHTMTFSSDGVVTYLSKMGAKYKAVFAYNTEQFNLLKILISEPKHIFSIIDLSKKVDRSNKKTFFLDDGRKVRDTVKDIKAKLKYKEGGLFVTRGGFGILCDVNLR